MEATVTHRPGSPARPAARELEELRPLGQAFLRRRFSGSLSAADAEDAVAEVVIRLAQRIESGRAPENLRAAFFTSVRNAAIDQLRSRASRPTVALEAAADTASDDTSPAESAEQRYEATRLREVIARMRPNYREALVLRFGAGLTVPEIGERLGLSLPAAKKLVLRATEQARQRLAAIEGEQFCPEMQALARRSLIDRRLAGLASEADEALLHTHLGHCASCRSFLAGLHHDLHELGSAALLIGLGAGRLGVSDHLTRLLGAASHGAHAVAAKARLAAHKAAAVLPSGEGATGALAGGSQKIAAICGATATTVCLAGGIVGPGIGAGALSHSNHAAQSSPPSNIRTVSEVPSSETPAPPSEPTPGSTSPGGSPTSSEHQASAATPEPTPSQQPSEEFGFENSAAPPEAAAAPEPTPTQASPSASPPASSPGSEGGAGEHFGFGG